MEKNSTYIFQFWGASPHIETAFELAIFYAEKGNKVDFFWGGDCVTFNEYNRSPSIGQIFESQKPYNRMKRISGKLTRQKINFHENWINPIKGNVDFEGDSSIEELKQVKFENFEVGTATVSSLSQLLKKDLKGDDFQKYLPYLQSIFKSGLEVYTSLSSLFSNSSPKEIILFNGRFINYAAVAAIAQKFNIRVKFHERASTQCKYMCVDYRIHDVESRKKAILNHWENCNNPEKKDLAIEWFENSINKGIATDWTSFNSQFDRLSDDQRQLEELGLERDKYFVFFQSSDDEYSAVASVKRNSTEWNNQKELVQFLSNYSKEKKIVLRIHPHMLEKSKDDLEGWLNFSQKNKNIVTILPDSKVNSYVLALNAAKVVTAGSTIGAETIYLGKPAISCAPCWWGDAVGAYECYDFKELEKLLKSNLKCNPETILPFGYYRGHHGYAFKYFEPTSLFTGKFDGLDVFQDESWI